MKLITTTFLLCISSFSYSFEKCWKPASERYDIPVIVLKAVSYVESSHKPKAMRKNRNGSFDYGLMQVNTRWIRFLKQYGITERNISNPCINVMVGAWILKQEIIRFGFNWKAIGAYHAGAYTRKNRDTKVARYMSYSAKVYRYIERNNNRH